MTSDQTNPPTTRLAWETLLELDGRGGLVEQLERAVRDAVRTGRAPAGAALPPSRRAAEALGVSRWVVTEAYGQLVGEGLLEARTGSTTRVAADAGTADRPGAHRSADVVRDGPPRARLDLAPGIPDLRHVPRAAWLRAAREALAVAPADALAGAPVAGHATTRAALAGHLRRSRLVDAPDDAVLLLRGATHGMAVVGAALVTAGHTHVLVEDPSWPVLREVARRAGLEPVPVPVDAGGVVVDALEAAARRTGARAALLTPAHQFPTGTALAPDRRARVLAWAREVDGLVVEDDYDAEFRYDRRPVAALQRLDPDRVVLLGSLSKTLAPAFGLGWAVTPPRWAGRLLAAAGRAGSGPSTVDQLAFAQLVAGGAYDRHLRATRARYRRRRDALVHSLAARLPTATPSGLAAGMHLLLDLGPDAPDAADVVRHAGERDVAVVDLRRYQVEAAERSRTLVLGYGNLADARVDEAVARLAASVRAAGG
ncbi:MocR-like pyridoxine biosynthesis transcription factor PdxR [Actinotalea solisilvae]|uniref:MocR-like pyridoxine biosynthesis transcription factor PdxR n=1 Tax=Actinotalea solisilvae TaxID=2072922 RepID=UPI0018F14183|nr:PLP-dependent aminotransferase family protein [Actinotalea solisilvae]